MGGALGVSLLETFLYSSIMIKCWDFLHVVGGMGFEEVDISGVGY